MGSGMESTNVLDLSSAYCMADKFGVEELQNVIMDYIRACLRVTNHPHVHAQGHRSVGRNQTNPVPGPEITELETNVE